MHTPLNIFLVTITQKFYDEITFESGITLYHDTTFHPEEHAMLQAKVVAVPKGIQQRQDYAGMTIDIREGDEILMRYDVVYSYYDQPDRATPVYKNILYHSGEEYWKVDIQQIFAVIRDGVTTMLNGYVLCEQYNEAVSHSFLYVPEHYQTVQRKDKLRVKNIGKALQGYPSLDVQEGDIVYCSPGVAQTYRINREEFCIIKQSHILGKTLESIHISI